MHVFLNLHFFRSTFYDKKIHLFSKWRKYAQLIFFNHKQNLFVQKISKNYKGVFRGILEKGILG